MHVHGEDRQLDRRLLCASDNPSPKAIANTEENLCALLFNLLL